MTWCACYRFKIEALIKYDYIGPYAPNESTIKKMER